MTIPVSTVDTVLDYLVATVTTQIGDASVLICDGPPGPYQPDDIVAIGETIAVVTDVHAFVGSGGQHWLSESYTVSVTISVFRGADSVALTWKRAKALADSVDTAVRTDPTLGGAVQLAWPSKTLFTSGWTENHAGRIVTVEKEISVEVEI
jgi:hypothetical protein